MPIGSHELEIGEEGEQLADEQGLLTPQDVFIFFQLYKEYVEGEGSPKIYMLDELYRREIWNTKGITRERILTSLFHLENKKLIDFRPPPGISDPSMANSSLNRWGFYRMNLPVDPDPNMTPEKIEELMRTKMLDARERIKGWMDIEKATTRIKKIEKEIEKSQRDMLRNMINIFGIFVAVFSFIVIGANTAMKIQPTQGFAEMLKQTTAFLLPIFLFILILLFLSDWIAKK